MDSSGNFQEFLRFIDSGQEVSLALAKDASELKHLQQLLDDHHFKQATLVSQLLLHIETPCKIYVLVQNRLSKNLYDFILQYPTGQVEIFDGKNLKSTVANPIYKNVSIVFLMTKETLTQIQKNNFQILDKVGITYQS